MAVAVALTLPDQPVIGENIFTGLAGDGWTAPQSVFEFAISSAGDASGDENTITMTFDPRFTGIMTYVRLSNSSASSAIEMKMQLLPLDRATPQLECFVNAVPVNGIDNQNTVTWSPPPVPTMRRLVAVTANVNGDTLSLMGYLYNFNINVLNKVPLNLILASLPRGDSIYPIQISQ